MGGSFALQPVCPVDLEHPALQAKLSQSLHCLPAPCPPALAQLAMRPAKKAKMDFLGQLSRKFVGSGDPEISDAKDVVTYLSEKYTPDEWKKLLQEFAHRLLNVIGMSFPTTKSTVPDVSVGSTEDFWVMVWHLGHLEEHAYRGRPQTVHILEKVQSFLEKTFDSESFPRSWHCQGLEPFQGRTLTIMSSSMLSASPASWLQW